jgi:hypothetical protein
VPACGCVMSTECDRADIPTDRLREKNETIDRRKPGID